MSASAGFRHYYEHDEMFVRLFGEFEKKYGYHNSFDGYYYRYRISEERWAFISKCVCSMTDALTGKPYEDLRDLLEGKRFHILTTNQDTQFTRVFPEEKISAIQGDWRYFQCSRCCYDELYDAVQPCHDKLYDSEPVVRKMRRETKNMQVPYLSIPRCPKCGRIMVPWVRDDGFLEGKLWRWQNRNYLDFLEKWQDKRLLLLELGVGDMTPGVIKFPFWQLTAEKVNCISVNLANTAAPEHLKQKTIAVADDLGHFLYELCQSKEEQEHGVI